MQNYDNNSIYYRNYKCVRKMDKRKFNFWQDHSINYLEMAFCDVKRETIKNPDGYGKKRIECGDAIEFFLIVQNGFLDFVSFNIKGCLHTTACANTVAHMAEGQKIEKAWDITPEKVFNYLETLPVEEMYCAELAVSALYKALCGVKKKQVKSIRKNIIKKI